MRMASAPQTPSAPRPTAPPRSERMHGRQAIALLLTGALSLVSLVVFALDMDDTASIAGLLYCSLAVAIGNLGLALLSRPGGIRFGILVLHGAMLFWFYQSGLQSFMETEQFSFNFAAIRADERHYLQALTMINVFYFMLMVGYTIRIPRRVQNFAAVMLGRDSLVSRQNLFWLVIGLFAFGFAFYIVAAGGIGGVIAAAKGSRQYQTAWDSDGNYGTQLSSLHFLFQGALVVAANLAFYATWVRERARARWLMALIFVLATGYVALESGTRNTLLLCIMPAFLVYFRKVRGLPIARQVAHYTVMFAMAMVVAGVSIYQHVHRNVGDTSQVRVDELEAEIDSDFLRETAGAVAVQEVRHGELVYEMPSLLVITGPVPRYIWKNKPAPSVYVVFSLYRFGIDVEKRGGNALPSVVGQYYMAWGWFGVIEAGFLIGLMVTLIDRAVATNPDSELMLMAGGFVLSYLFVVFRYISFGFFPPVMVMLMVVLVLRRRRRRQPQHATGSPQVGRRYAT